MNKNLRTVKMTVTAQTLHHLQRMAALGGWGEKDIGRVVDKLVRTHQAQQRRCCAGEEKYKNEGGQENA